MCSESDRSGSTTQQLGIANEAMAKKLLHAVTPWKKIFIWSVEVKLGVLVYATLKYKKSKITVRIIIWAMSDHDISATLICIMKELGLPVKLCDKSFIFTCLEKHTFICNSEFHSW